MRAGAPLSIPENLGTVEPVQWSARQIGGTGTTGLSRLGAAILHEAWEDLTRLPRGSKPYREALRFFLGPVHPRAAVSLELACALADVDPDHVRRCVRRQLRGR